MKIRRACNPEGPGLRGLITSNVVRGGRVPRGSVALATITAPRPARGSRSSAGRARCGAATAATRSSSGPTRPASSRSRSRTCARTSTARARRARRRPATARARSTSPGATRIVQRVICVGGHGTRKSAPRAARTTSAPTRPRSGSPTCSPPTAAILGDTPLARGEWVRGTQPLNYDASDNVGVRMADAIARRPSRRLRAAAVRVRGARAHVRGSGSVPERPRSDRRRTRPSFSEGTQSLVVRAQDTGGQRRGLARR